MVEPILHFIIPVVMLLAFKPKIDKKLVLGLSILTIALDFDFIMGHRVLHNFLFVLFLSIIIYLAFRFVINHNHSNRELENRNAFYLSLYYLFFHLLLDFGRPGIPLLYPFSTNLYGFNFNFIMRSYNFSGLPLIESKGDFINQSFDEAIKTQDIWVITTLGVLLLIVFVVLIFNGFKKETF